jgi:hypothetical protein
MRAGDNDAGRCLQIVQSLLQSRVFHNHAASLAVEKIANGLRLKLLDAALGRFLVDGHHQHGRFIRPYQIAQKHRGLGGFRRRNFRELCAEFIHAFAGGRDEFYIGELFLFEAEQVLRIGRAQIRFVHRNKHGNSMPAEFGKKLLLEVGPHTGLDDEHADIGASDSLARLLDALRAERANVIHSGRINKKDRPDGKQFHWLLDRIGRCARHRRHD